MSPGPGSIGEPGPDPRAGASEPLAGLCAALEEGRQPDLSGWKTREAAGGCISRVIIVEEPEGNGGRIVLKLNSRVPSDFFTAEAAGLAALARELDPARLVPDLRPGTGEPKSGTDSRGVARPPREPAPSGLRLPAVPRVLAVGRMGILLEYVGPDMEPGTKAGPQPGTSPGAREQHGLPSGSDAMRDFGRGLAAMHLAAGSPTGTGHAGPMETALTYGFEQDNYLGLSLQINDARDSWPEFFRDCRLLPQIERAARAGIADRSLRMAVESLCGKLEELLPDTPLPSLLHGDLWAGNYLTGAQGKAYLIDPAVSRGHSEADIAMTRLFGGFPPSFYEGYDELLPPQPGNEERQLIYNLYHILNHLNLFGGSYGSQARFMLRSLGF